MQVINFSELRKNMKDVMSACCENHELTIITRQQETMYLMQSPKNHARLMRSIENVRKNRNLQQHGLIENDDDSI